MSAFEVFILTIAVAGLFLISYDIYRIKKGLSSISSETRVISTGSPILAWAFGIVIGALAGHFWWSNY